MARPGFISHVLYRRTTDFTFDLEYYNAYHIPLCLKLWEPRGVVEHYVTQMTDSQAELAYLITMVWKDEVRIRKSGIAHSAMTLMMVGMLQGGVQCRERNQGDHG